MSWCLTLSLMAPYLMASSSRSALLCASRSSSLPSSPCSTRFSSWRDMTEDMAPAAEAKGTQRQQLQERSVQTYIWHDGEADWGHSQLSLRFFVTISLTRAGRHVGGASGEGPRTVNLFSSDKTLSSSLWCTKHTHLMLYSETFREEMSHERQKQPSKSYKKAP